MKKPNSHKKPYTQPQLETLGAVVELTQVGRKNSGDDVWPGNANHEGGSVTHSNAGGNGRGRR